MNRVAIIIPYYNREDYLERTLLSVEAQTFRPIDLVLVNNNSTDKSEAIVEEFAKRSTEDFKVINLRETKFGAAAARNAGLKSILDEYVYFFDSDDVMSPDFIEQAVEAASKPNVDVVAAVTVIRTSYGGRIVRNYGMGNSPYRQILSGMLSTQALFMKTSFVKRIGGWNEDLMYWNDWEMGLRVLLASPKLVWLKGRTFHTIFQHKNSITGLNYHEATGKIIKAIMAALNDVENSPISLARKVKTALSFRAAIMSGLIDREGFPREASKMMNLSLEIAPSRMVKVEADILKRYVRLGGRGAWRVALWLV